MNMQLSRRIIIVLSVFAIVTALVLPAIAQTPGGQAGGSSSAYRVIVYGDSRTSSGSQNDASHRSVLKAIMAKTPDYRFMINVGDIAYNGDVSSYWETWKNTVLELLGPAGIDQSANPPRYMGAVGNHDRAKLSLGLENWNKYLPGQVRFGNQGRFFYFDYENARYLVLDSDTNPSEPAQLELIKKACETNTKPWLFAVWHHPMFTFTSKKEDHAYTYQAWGKLLHSYGCDIIFVGDSHHYVRTAPLVLDGSIHPRIARDGEVGTTQIITGNGGASLYAFDLDVHGHKYMAEKYLATAHGYTELSFEGPLLFVNHILADGTVFDSVMLLPNPKKPPQRQ